MELPSEIEPHAPIHAFDHRSVGAVFPQTAFHKVEHPRRRVRCSHRQLADEIEIVLILADGSDCSADPERALRENLWRVLSDQRSGNA